MNYCKGVKGGGGRRNNSGGVGGDREYLKGEQGVGWGVTLREMDLKVISHLFIMCFHLFHLYVYLFLLFAFLRFNVFISLLQSSQGSFEGLKVERGREVLRTGRGIL